MRRAVLAVVAAVALVGCGGDDDQEQAETAAPATDGGKAASAVDATMEGFEFVPAKITVAAGGRVTWTDKDSSNHNVKFDSPEAPEGIGNLREGESASITFDDPGSFAFVCTYHPNMKGTVVVR